MNPQSVAVELTEMEAAIERLREEIRKLKEERNALEQGNLDLYRELTTPDF
jgi:prefoldin subunit 5